MVYDQKAVQSSFLETSKQGVLQEPQGSTEYLLGIDALLHIGGKKLGQGSQGESHLLLGNQSCVVTPEHLWGLELLGFRSHLICC